MCLRLAPFSLKEFIGLVSHNLRASSILEKLSVLLDVRVLDCYVTWFVLNASNFVMVERIKVETFNKTDFCQTELRILVDF